MHSHSTTRSKIVRNILRIVAIKKRIPYPEIKKLFTVDCDRDISLDFWHLLRKYYPKHTFTEVSHCPGCGEFDLE